jgi:hypothetical protein
MTTRLIPMMICLGAVGSSFAATPAPADVASRAASADVQGAEPAVTTPPPAKPAAKLARPAGGGAKGGGGGALDRLELETTQITGNRELPKVMVIVPWKHADIGDLAGRPTNSLVDEALKPVDRDVFRRELAYFDAVSSEQVRTETAVTPPKRDAGAEK